MSLEFARAILRTHDEDERWELCCDGGEQFIWAEYGDEVDQFNRLAVAFPEAVTAGLEGENDDIRMRYRDRTVKVPLLFDRDDNLRAVHTLSQLTRADLEFRMLADTSGNSEQAFLMLPAAQWRQLEAEFGVAAVARRFMPVAPNFDTFREEAFA